MRNVTTVLVVDDDADVRELLKIILEAAGYRVNVAADGLDALEQINAGSRPSLILLDLMMPRLDGEQFVKRIRAGVFKDIPIIVLSGHSAAEKISAELNAVCLMKPVEVDELLRTIGHYALARKPAA
jgi:CheY-like chemotaxis protein